MIKKYIYQHIFLFYTYSYRILCIIIIIYVNFHYIVYIRKKNLYFYGQAADFDGSIKMSTMSRILKQLFLSSDIFLQVPTYRLYF